MQNHVLAIANEFDSYMQDRAQRLGYGVRWPSIADTAALSASARLALVEFRDALADGHAIAEEMRGHRDRGHFVAWAEEAGALVQMNVYRREIGAGAGQGAASRIGVRTFAEEFFGNAQGRSLALDEFKLYLGSLAAGNGSAATLALVARNPETRELLLVHLPSVRAAANWLQCSMAA